MSIGMDMHGNINIQYNIILNSSEHQDVYNNPTTPSNPTPNPPNPRLHKPTPLLPIAAPIPKNPRPNLLQDVRLGHQLALKGGIIGLALAYALVGYLYVYGWGLVWGLLWDVGQG